MNYEGEIRIKYGVKSSKNRVVKIEDYAFLVFITGNPAEFEVYDDLPPSGYYTSYHYYYADSTVKLINTSGFPDRIETYYPYVSNRGFLWPDMNIYWVYRDEKSHLKEDPSVDKSL